jgi:Mrp family chromosome partitioning ATPase
MGAQSSGRYDFILLDGPTLPARKRDRRLLNRQPALLLVLPLNLRINERMEAALAALGPASSNLIGVILNEAVDA